MQFFAGLFVNVTQDDRPLRVRSRSSLHEEPSTAIVLGEAPDGLPLILQVERRASVQYAVLNALGQPTPERLPPRVAHALHELEAAVAAEARNVGLREIEGRTCYVTASGVGNLMGDTLLARILGTQSPLILEDDRNTPSSQPELSAITAAIVHRTDSVQVLTHLRWEGVLAVPLNEGGPMVLEGGAEGASEFQRGFQLETLRKLKSAHFHATQDKMSRNGSLSDEPGYESVVRTAEVLAWSVDRNEVGRLLVELANHIQTLHAAERVHGDVKPANTLLCEGGTISIDPVVVSAGEVSPAATPGWAAPEQILARPVSPATDVYSLGLMAARLAEAAIYGEERSFIVPTGGSDRRRMRVLADPGAFIDPTHVPLDDAGRKAWQGFLSRCVAFQPATRPKDGATFANELSELLANHPLTGRMPLKSGPGRLTRNAEILGGLQPCWVLLDRR